MVDTGTCYRCGGTAYTQLVLGIWVIGICPECAELVKAFLENESSTRKLYAELRKVLT